MEHLKRVDANWKRECFEKMIELWSFLADNPMEPKINAYINLSLEDDKNFCPCCEYVVNVTSDVVLDCDLCPLRHVWPVVEKEPEDNYTPCTLEGSPYINWSYSKNKTDRKKWASIILNESIKALNKLNKDEMGALIHD